MFIRPRSYCPDEPSTGTGSGSGDGGAPSGASGTPSTGTGAPAGGPPATTGQGEPQDVASLPQWAQTVIHNARSEAAEHRQKKSAAETERDGIREAAKVALGLADAPTPEQLSEQLRNAQTETRQARVEAAIARSAGTHGADAGALLDSRSFLDTVSGFDHTAADFTTKVADAIKAATEANPKLRSTPATGEGERQYGGARRPAPDRSQGSGGSGQSAPVSSVQTGRDLYRARNGKTAATGS